LLVFYLNVLMSRFFLVNIACQLLLLLPIMLLDSCLLHLILMLRSKAHCWMLNFHR